jgi:hypothetical protein
MNTRIHLVLAFLTAACSCLHAASRDAQWIEVDDATARGLPRTAIDKLEPILESALREQAWGEATRAITRRITLEAQIEGGRPDEQIVRMQREIDRAPEPIVPLLQTIQAHWYWQYFQQNRWRFMQRTATHEPPGEDFTTWDLPRLFAEIDRRFQAALAHVDVLQQIPIGTFDDLLIRGTLPDRYRPTLYDFIAHEALSFYASGEQAGAKPQDSFVLSAESPIFDSPDPFLEWTPEHHGDPDSPSLRAIHLFQGLLRFHRDDSDPTAFIDVDLARLVYGGNTASGETRDARYFAALDRFIQEWADHEVAAIALYQWARQLQAKGELIEAHRLAQRGRDTHPNTPGGRSCLNLIQQLEARSIAIRTERVWNNPLPPLSVQYRNVTNVHFRAVAWDWAEFLDRRRPRPENPGDRERKEILSRTPTLAWSATLPPTTDFNQHTERVPAPDSLKSGFYFLIASHNPDFGDEDNVVTFTSIWVSDLALIVRPHKETIEGFVLEAGSGEPIQGAEIMTWHLDRQGNRIPHGPLMTDEFGFFRARIQTQFGHLVRARHDGQELATLDDVHVHSERRVGVPTRTVFFTDRALYRPGQTIQYKGICLRPDAQQDDYRTLDGQQLTVVLRDPNGREIARANHRCNDYGSFSGSFSAPREGLLGRMTLQALDGPPGLMQIQIEEYKRPRFRVALEAPRTAPRLHDSVTLTGTAESYTGAAIDNAEVRYRVVREVHWPYWHNWFGGGRRPVFGSSQEIAHGTAETDNAGHFQVSFNALPDPDSSEKDEVTFSFTVYADVTDGAGETRTAQRTVNVGFVALNAVLTANEWQTANTEIELTVRTTTLDAEPQSAEGVIRVHHLKPPAQVHRRRPLDHTLPPWDPTARSDAPDLSNPNHWELGDLAIETGFTTDTAGAATVRFKLGAGAYRAILETQDRFGKTVTAQLPVQVLDPTSDHLNIKVPHLLAAPKWSVEPGSEFTALWGTGYDTGRAFIEIERRGELIQRYWTEAGRTQAQITQSVTEAMRGGFTLHVTRVRENRAYIETRRIEVPWTNKQLDVTWERFTSKLGPAQKETWTAIISKEAGNNTASGDAATAAADPQPSAERAAAEMVATLYDASLDAFLPHDWNRRFDVFPHHYTWRQPQFANLTLYFQHLHGRWQFGFVDPTYSYRSFPYDVLWSSGGQFTERSGLMQRSRGIGGGAEMQLGLDTLAAAPLAEDGAQAFALPPDYDTGRPAPTPPTPDLARVTARRNLSETAFFFPHLVADTNGVVRMSFTMPEALTTWRFMGFAHDAQLRSGYIEGQTVTSKDLMVQPNPPRFLREQDELEFTVKVSNQSPARQAGRVRVTFNEALSDASADQALGNASPELEFDIPSMESRSFSWRIKVPDGMGYLTYKAVAATTRLSDGEEGYLPVLSRRILVTESMPLPIRGPGTNQVRFEKLLESDQSSTLQHQNLVVQMASNPTWYAVLALPYLMEFPHECTEQTFNRLYANTLARHVALSNPRIRRIFDQWKNTASLDSPLEKNEDLKSVAIEETPWLRQAQNESQARRNVGVLFDENRLNSEFERLLRKMTELQLPDGSWSWFPGGRPNDFITLYITTGFGRLRHLGVDMDVGPAIRALDRLDSWITDRHRQILAQPSPDDHIPDTFECLYLYGRSFFLADRPVTGEHLIAVDFFLAQARKRWVKLTHRQSQGHLALALKRFNAAHAMTDPTPSEIMRSLKERSVTDSELGRFWRDTEYSWWWYRAPIETQALMIEAFDEVMGDATAVEDCQVWLLKQKQTQDWKSTKATADAVYALLLRGTDRLASDLLVEVRLGELDVTPQRGASGAPAPAPSRVDRGQPPAIEPGTGYYERRFNTTEVQSGLGDVTVTKKDPGVAWGAIHWQYLEDVSRVTPHEGTPLRLVKRLFTKSNTSQGPVLEPVRGSLAVGDELVVRVELRVDRDVEYVHLKDQRGSGTEPLNVLSRYKYQDGLAYYESTRDTASHFFIDYLPKGTYVFEYGSRVQHRGSYQTGIASIQCLYAPEFNSHSESHLLEVRD